jgi:ribosomal subunit interface protein
VLDAPTAGSRKAEMTVKILDKVLHAHAEEDNMHKAIESMLGKIERQLKKENEKMKVHKSAPIASLIVE